MVLPTTLYGGISTRPNHPQTLNVGNNGIISTQLLNPPTINGDTYGGISTPLLNSPSINGDNYGGSSTQLLNPQTQNRANYGGISTEPHNLQPANEGNSAQQHNLPSQSGNGETGSWTSVPLHGDDDAASAYAYSHTSDDTDSLPGPRDNRSNGQRLYWVKMAFWTFFIILAFLLLFVFLMSLDVLLEKLGLKD